MAHVIELTNSNALEWRELADFFKMAFAGSFLKRASWEDVKPALGGFMDSPNAAVFLGLEGDRFAGGSIILLPEVRFIPYPQVVHLFCFGSPTLRRALVTKVVDFARENGYSTIWAINGSGKPDSVWKRAFRSAGPARKIGSIMAFDLEA